MVLQTVMLSLGSFVVVGVILWSNRPIEQVDSFTV